jgi:phosphoglycolate phosphatase-like HAD superfamily hydrolase
MEIKHKECFIPNIIRHFGLQAISKYAREAAEFVNLYSTSRGINRFPALIQVLDLVRARREVSERNANVPQLPATRAWMQREKNLANPALAAAVATAPAAAGEELRGLLNWSEAVNAAIAEMVHGIPPFPRVRECIALAAESADLMVVSATPTEALRREWAEHDLARFIGLIAGQELGAKRTHLRVALELGGYAPDHALMVGDAPGDLQAARDNHVLFYPIIPGTEADSWRRFEAEALPRFLAGQYAGHYADARVAEFEAVLPNTPPWAA